MLTWNTWNTFAIPCGCKAERTCLPAKAKKVTWNTTRNNLEHHPKMTKNGEESEGELHFL